MTERKWIVEDLWETLSEAKRGLATETEVLGEVIKALIYIIDNLPESNKEASE